MLIKAEAIIPASHIFLNNTLHTFAVLFFKLSILHSPSIFPFQNYFLGAEGMGCEEFRRKLVETDPERFESPITCKQHIHKIFIEIVL